MNLEDAINTIENCSGFTDTSTPVGEAWARVLEEIEKLEWKSLELKYEGNSIK